MATFCFAPGFGINAKRILTITMKSVESALENELD